MALTARSVPVLATSNVKEKGASLSPGENVQGRQSRTYAGAADCARASAAFVSRPMAVPIRRTRAATASVRFPVLRLARREKTNPLRDQQELGALQMRRPVCQAIQSA